MKYCTQDEEDEEGGTRTSRQSEKSKPAKLESKNKKEPEADSSWDEKILTAVQETFCQPEVRTESVGEGVGNKK